MPAKSCSLLILLFLALCAPNAMAAEPYSTQPNYDPVPGEFGAGQQRMIVPLPPQLPLYLPNGAINLDEVWTQDGGARLYWNTVIIPRELKMAGSSWIDPALVPQLIPDQPVRSTRKYRRSARTAVKKVKVPPNVASTALKSPAIPLPVTPTPTKQASKPIPPLTAPARAATRSAPVAPSINIVQGNEEMTDITPPRLQ